jgi:hypothetical protein
MAGMFKDCLSGKQKKILAGKNNWREKKKDLAGELKTNPYIN